MVHAAISGSTNATMHLPAIAHEFGIEIDADTFDRMHRGAHYLLNIRPSGDWPAQYFYYAGGVPRVMEEIRSMLHLDAMTVTGKTLGENLDALKKSSFYEHCDELLREKTAHLSRRPPRTDIIRTFENAKGTDGSIAILALTLPRKSMGITLKYLGYSMNSREVPELMAAKNKLIEQKQSGVVKAYQVDETKDKMVAGEAALALMWSGDAQYAIDLNDHLDYFCAL